MASHIISEALDAFATQAKIMEAFGREALLFTAPPPAWAQDLVRNARGIRAAIDKERASRSPCAVPA